MFHSVPLDVFVEALDDDDGVVGSELLAPEFLQIVAPGVVEAREFPIIKRGLPRLSTVVPHRRQQILSVPYNDDSGINKREDSIVFLVRFCSAQLAELSR